MNDNIKYENGQLVMVDSDFTHVIFTEEQVKGLKHAIHAEGKKMQEKQTAEYKKAVMFQSMIGG